VLTKLKPTRISATLGVLVAAALLFTVLSVALLKDHRSSEDRRSQDAEILSAAKSGVTAMISVRDTSAADDVKNVLDQSTGAFKKDFEARSQSFISVVQEAKVVTQGDIAAQGIESRDGDTATVLVAATSSVSNAAGATNETRSWRLRVTMTNDEGQYKMSNVEFVA
jgi:Mce-associated membrane protein